MNVDEWCIKIDEIQINILNKWSVRIDGFKLMK